MNILQCPGGTRQLRPSLGLAVGVSEVKGGKSSSAYKTRFPESRLGSATPERLARRLWLDVLASGAAGGRAPPRLLVCGKV